MILCTAVQVNLSNTVSWTRVLTVHWKMKQDCVVEPSCLTHTYNFDPISAVQKVSFCYENVSLYYSIQSRCRITTKKCELDKKIVCFKLVMAIQGVLFFEKEISYGNLSLSQIIRGRGQALTGNKNALWISLLPYTWTSVEGWDWFTNWGWREGGGRGSNSENIHSTVPVSRACVFWCVNCS